MSVDAKTSMAFAILGEHLREKGSVHEFATVADHLNRRAIFNPDESGNLSVFLRVGSGRSALEIINNLPISKEERRECLVLSLIHI